MESENEISMMTMMSLH